MAGLAAINRMAGMDRAHSSRDVTLAEHAAVVYSGPR
jgi:hypothetical protein